MSPENPHVSLIQHASLFTGLTRTEVIGIARNAPKRYKSYPIAKRTGGDRIICQPSRELKALQYSLLETVLQALPVHDSATAYKKGSSIRDNAAAHRNSRIILKLDFLSFFNSIKTKDWLLYARRLFPGWTNEDLQFSAFVLFWGEGGYQPVCLSIGAPTSPLISNALMYDFDVAVSGYASDHSLVYTRYADDLTFSSQGHLDRHAVIEKIGSLLAEMKSPKLELNHAKTRIASKATMRMVTGLVLTNDGNVSLGRDRKRLIRAMVHRALAQPADEEFLARLRGLLSFAQDVEPTFWARLMQKYGEAQIKSLWEN